MANYFLQNEDWTCNGVAGRKFFEFPFDLLRPSTEKHVLLLDEIKDVQFRDSSDSWVLLFSYKAFSFCVDSHSHSTTTSFIVVQPECPDEVLLQVIGVFCQSMKIAADYEPTEAELVQSPAQENTRNFYLRWGMRAVAILLFCLAISCLFNGNHENAVWLGAGTIFLTVVSFCADFAPYNTY